MKKIWQHPWGYIESIIIIAGFLSIGTILEFMHYSVRMNMPPFPSNIYILFSTIAFISISYFTFSSSAFMRFFTSIHWNISAMCCFLLFIIAAGIFPQGNNSSHSLLNRLGIYHIIESRQFILIVLLIFLSLICVVLKRIRMLANSTDRKISAKNIAFILNHFGFLAIMAGFIFGKGDYAKLKITLEEGKVQWLGFDEQTPHPISLPFAFKLNDFILEEYPVEIALINTSGDSNHNSNKSRHNIKIAELLENVDKYTLGDWEIQIQKRYTYAFKVKEEYVPLIRDGAVPAVFVSAENKKTNQKKEGWISFGSQYVPGSALELDNSQSLEMLPEKIKSYCSKVILYLPDGKKIEDIQIRVNEPFKYTHWQFYQSGYERERGKFSETSILEAVKDPWMNVIYSGAIFLILGAILMMTEIKSKFVLS